MTVVVMLVAEAHASNFATCILDKMPGSANQAMHAAVFHSCSREHPLEYRDVEQGEGRGLFGFADGNDCTIKKAAGTTYPPSAGAIARACRCLYDKTNPFDKRDQNLPGPAMCETPPVPWEAYAPLPAKVEPRKPTPPPASTAKEKHYSAIFAAHPDALSVYESANFKKWLSGPGKQWGATPDLGTTDQVIAMFRAYKVYEQTVTQAQAAERAAEIRRQEQVKQQQERAKRQQIHEELQAAADRAVERFPFLNEPKYAHVLKQIIETRDQLIAQGVHPPLALTRAVNDHAYAHDPRGQKLPIVEVLK